MPCINVSATMEWTPSAAQDHVMQFKSSTHSQIKFLYFYFIPFFFTVNGFTQGDFLPNESHVQANFEVSLSFVTCPCIFLFAVVYLYFLLYLCLLLCFLICRCVFWICHLLVVICISGPPQVSVLLLIHIQAVETETVEIQSQIIRAFGNFTGVMSLGLNTPKPNFSLGHSATQQFLGWHVDALLTKKQEAVFEGLPFGNLAKTQ